MMVALCSAKSSLSVNNNELAKNRQSLTDQDLFKFESLANMESG